MAMERNTFTVSYSAKDEAGNGNSATFEQVGIPAEMLLELQAPVAQMTAQLQAIVNKWAGAARAQRAGNQAVPGQSAEKKG